MSVEAKETPFYCAMFMFVLGEIWRTIWMVMKTMKKKLSGEPVEKGSLTIIKKGQIDCFLTSFSVCCLTKNVKVKDVESYNHKFCC